MTAIITALAGIALAGVTTFGLVSAADNTPDNATATCADVSYDACK